MAKAQATIGPRASRLDPSEWCSYFQTIGSGGEGLLASVVLGTWAGARSSAVVARPLLGIAYDTDAQAITVRVGGANSDEPFLRYFVSAPRSIEVHEDDQGEVIVVVDVSGACTLIHISRACVTLPAETPNTATAERDEPPG